MLWDFQQTRTYKFKINNKTIDFVIHDRGKHTATGETHKTYLSEDEPQEPIIYNSSYPEEAVLVDSLPKGVRRFFEAEIEQLKSENKCL